ncbi:MAG: pantoate--beta-alanine ligase [Saprospiraceae bacterium]|nr:pantoate--beta-alanine ligase [Saprospiraceae bacterium]
MKIITTNQELIHSISDERLLGRSIGFVPTMGALHQGHLDLIRASLDRNCYTVCSIFVNPTQFNDPKDLEKYPRTLSSDSEMLLKAGCDLLFAPDVAEIYPKVPDTTPSFDMIGMDRVMEGKFRPGHFDGVVQVVYRLLDLVKPDHLFMGLKDYQQQAIIGRMILALNLPVFLVSVETTREEDGLAMSSRNARLTPEWRQKAPIIFETLQAVKTDVLAGKNISRIEAFYFSKLTELGFRMEYLEICNPLTLQPISHFKDKAVVCIALWAGDVRLIDNILIIA